MALGAVQLFSLISRHNQWLAARQATLAGNIANANTPGYKALDVEDFNQTLDTLGLSMATTQPAHMTSGATQAPVAVRPEDTWDVTHSGNSVSLEQELLKAGEVNRAYRLNTSIAKAFNRMMLAATKG
ncbi:MAG TPA: flagellar basal body rod protein FlgB [Hyphomicrobiaceae bacterium]|jgi:flagellar basal-body rod protein FlgB|nr:flagellar basal body rod protein FlgB [Hyphomicrobiaceae bacterium]